MRTKREVEERKKGKEKRKKNKVKIRKIDIMRNEGKK